MCSNIILVVPVREFLKDEMNIKSVELEQSRLSSIVWVGLIPH